MIVNHLLREDVNLTIEKLIEEINPYDRTKDCINSLHFNSGKKILVSIGKAAWTMAKAVSDNLDIDDGVVITKYNHSKGEIKNLKVFEAGHPIMDDNSIKACEYALSLTSHLNENDNVIFCISGGGSALFEKPLISLDTLQDINNQLLKSGADINEINIIRKRLSMVKAGRFALHCSPALINAVILSDVVGNDLSSIASGPVSVDKYTSIDAFNVIDKYHICINDEVRDLLNKQTPKEVNNVKTHIIGSVEQLCLATKSILENMGYEVSIIEDNTKDNVEELAKRFGSLKIKNNYAYIIGGESVVEVKGNGLGGRNSELALLCSRYIKNLDNVCVFTFGSDGTDGPTDAAGGYVDGNTYNIIDVESYLANNDSYHALQESGGLIITGPTGSNVNDVYVMLCR